MHAGGRRYTAVFVLLVINLAIWGLWQFARSNDSLLEFMRANFTVSRSGILTELRLHTLLSSCFSHEDLMHILFNMLFFWILAGDVERIYGFRNLFWLYAFTGNAGDGTVSVVDLVRLQKIATNSVGPSPSGLRVHPKFDQVWGVSTEGGFAFVIDAATGRMSARIQVGEAPFAVDFSPDGLLAYVAASGSATLLAIECRTGRVVERAHTGRRPWLARAIAEPAGG
jgi:DNA-binding beta-propeller fold protein YncE